MSESVFTKIIRGEIPSYKVYEDDKALVFLDIAPYTEGHCLVIPKKEVDHLWDLDDELYLHLMSVAKKVAERQRDVLHPKRVGVVVEGFAVPHVHIHVFPMNEGLEATIEHAITPPSSEEFETMVKRLRF